MIFKKKNTERSFKFIGITVFCGTVLIFLLFTFESNPFKDSDFDIPLNSLETELRDEISDFMKANPFTPANYPILLTKINSAAKQGLIQSSTENELIYRLTTDYKTKVFDLCEIFLTRCSNNKHNLYWDMLTNLEKRIGKDKQIDFYRKQVSLAFYYDVKAPIDILLYSSKQYSNNFSTFDYCGNEDKIKQFQHPSLNSSYISCRQTEINRLINTLRSLRTDYCAGPGWWYCPISCPN